MFLAVARACNPPVTLCRHSGHGKPWHKPIEGLGALYFILYTLRRHSGHGKPSVFSEFVAPRFTASSHTACLCGDVLYLIGGNSDLAPDTSCPLLPPSRLLMAYLYSTSQCCLP